MRRIAMEIDVYGIGYFPKSGVVSTRLIPVRNPNSANPLISSKILEPLRVLNGHLASLTVLSRKNSQYRVMNEFHQKYDFSPQK